MALPRAHLVEPLLFRRVIAYADAIRANQVDIDKPLANTTPVIVFCENFYLQFFENVLGTEITGINDSSQKLAARLRRKLKRNKDAVHQRRLLALFEALRNLWDEIRGEGYGFREHDFDDFHHEFMPQFLSQIFQWSLTVDDEELVSAVRAAEGAYGEVLPLLVRPTPHRRLWDFLRRLLARGSEDSHGP